MLIDTCEVDGCNDIKVNYTHCNRHKSYLHRWGTLTRVCKSCGKNFTYSTKKENGNGMCLSCNEIRKRFGRNYEYHGLTAYQFYTIYLNQKGRCALCGYETEKLTIDHDHNCCHLNKNKSCGHCVRGLLCHICNLMIGWIEKHFNFNVNEYLCGSRVL